MTTKTTKQTKTSIISEGKVDFLNKKKPTKLEFLTRKIQFFKDKIQQSPIILQVYQDAMRCDMCDGIVNKDGTPKIAFGSISFMDENKFTGDKKLFKIHRICEECLKNNEVTYTDWFAIRAWIVNHPNVSVSTFETSKQICQLCGEENECLKVHVGIEKLAVSVHICQKDMDKIIIDDASLERLRKAKADQTKFEEKCTQLGIKARKGIKLFTNAEVI